MKTVTDAAEREQPGRPRCRLHDHAPGREGHRLLPAGFRGCRQSQILDSLRFVRHRLTAAQRVQGSTIGQCRSEEHTSELQSLMSISYAVFCLKKKTT